MKTEIAKDIETAGYSIQYDTQCKKVLANKRILAWIMKEAVTEFSHLSIDYIYNCIEREPEIGIISTEPGCTNTKEKITGINTEDKVQNEVLLHMIFVLRYLHLMKKLLLRLFLILRPRKIFTRDILL